MLVIDTTARALSTYTANVTVAEAGLVIRAALELPGLAYMAKGHTWKEPLNVDLPVLLLGTGWQAESSHGHVSVRGARSYATVVGKMVFGEPLRFAKPTPAMLLGPVRIIADKVMGNSNYATAEAAKAGLDLLSKADPRAIVIEEGASDYSAVYRLLPLDPTAKSIDAFSVDSLAPEHQAWKFTVKSVLANQLSYHANRKVRGEWGHFSLSPEYVVQLVVQGSIGTVFERQDAVRAYAHSYGVDISAFIEGEPMEKWEIEMLEGRK